MEALVEKLCHRFSGVTGIFFILECVILINRNIFAFRKTSLGLL